jgi:hypothetical protein
MYKRKPDLLVVLAIVVALGVFFTGLAQAMLCGEPAEKVLIK